jgi:hypothetical protein
MILGSTQPLAEISTRNISEDKQRSTLKDNNLISIVEPIFFRKCGNLGVSQSYRPPQPLTGTVFTVDRRDRVGRLTFSNGVNPKGTGMPNKYSNASRAFTKLACNKYYGENVLNSKCRRSII